MPFAQRNQQFAQAAARRQKVAALYLRGRYQAEIAQELHVSQQQISKDLRTLQAAWLTAALCDFDARKAIELQRLDAIEREAWEAWERSKEPREVTITEASEGTHTGRKATMRKEGQAGDPRFLAEIGKCVDRRCSILGIGMEQAALKSLGLGLAGLLEEAKQWHAAPPLLPQPFAQA